jgi:hypothetical protein
MKVFGLKPVEAAKILPIMLVFGGMLFLFEVAMPVDTESGVFESTWVLLPWLAAKLGIAWLTVMLLFAPQVFSKDKGGMA